MVGGVNWNENTPLQLAKRELTSSAWHGARQNNSFKSIRRFWSSLNGSSSNYGVAFSSHWLLLSELSHCFWSEQF